MAARGDVGAVPTITGTTGQARLAGAHCARNNPKMWETLGVSGNL